MGMSLSTVIPAVLLAAALAASLLAWLQHRKAAAKLQRLRVEEQELLERLAGGLAHELKNPLGALNLNLQLLQEELEADSPLPPESRRRLALIMKECRRLEDVLAGFLRYAMRRPLERVEVSLNELVDDVLTFLKPEIRSAGVETVTDFDEALPPLNLDPSLMKQALMNVVINALEAMPGGGELRVRTGASRSSAFLVVSDTGEGMPPEVAPHVFEAYFSTKKGGTGLGLAVTERIIEKHGGTVTIENQPGRGAAVTISLPLDAGEQF